MNKKNIISCLKKDDAAALFKKANIVRRKFCGDKIHCRGLIEFSNYCKKDCLYCGIRKSNKNLQRYRMNYDEIFQAAKDAGERGCKTIVLQSGEDDYYKIKNLCDLIRKIRKETNSAITLCIGEKTYKEYKALKNAGADRYLLKFETSNKKLFNYLKTDSSFENRLTCLKWLKEIGFQTGSGVMVGLPGQSVEILADDILLLKKLDLDMIGIGPFISHDNTPLKGALDGTVKMSLKALALVRILTLNTHIPVTTSLGSIDMQARKKAFKCGANVIMPNMTPEKYKKYYNIYPNKRSINEENPDEDFSIKKIEDLLNVKISTGYGHSIKREWYNKQKDI